MERLAIVRQPTVHEVLSALSSEPGVVKMTVSDGHQESDRLITVISVTNRRTERQFDFTGRCPHTSEVGTQYWDVYVKHLTDDPKTATFEEHFFFL